MSVSNKKPKYDWTNVPDHINWIATYAPNGHVYGYINKPYRKPNSDIWYETGGEWRHRVPVEPYKGHWTQSLEKRPLRGAND